MQSRTTTLFLIRIAMACSLAVPVALFAFTGWRAYKNVKLLADERIVRSLDLQQEQALKSFQLIDLALTNVGELLARKSKTDIESSSR